MRPSTLVAIKAILEADPVKSEHDRVELVRALGVETPQPQAENVKLFTITQAAREGGFSRTTACRMVKAGTLRTVELRPGCRRVPASELVRIAKGDAQ